MSMWLTNTAPVFAVAFAPDGGQADAGTVTVTVTRADSTVLVTGAATTTSGTAGTTIYKWALPVANNSRVDILTLKWTRTDTAEILTTTEELVGALLFTETGLKAFEDGGVGNTVAAVSDINIMVEHLRIVDWIEHRTGRAWIPRYGRAKFPGPSHHDSYRLPLFTGTWTHGGAGWTRDIRTLITVTDNGTSVATSNVELADGALIRTDGSWTSATRSTPYPIVVDYEYGQQPNLGVSRIAQLVARRTLVPSPISNYQIPFDGDGPPLSLSDQERIEVLSWLKQHSRHVPVA